MKGIFGKTAMWSFGTIAMAAVAFAAAPQRGGREQVELPAGEVRGIILHSCTTCHGINEYLRKRGSDRPGWQSVIDSMKAKGSDLPDKDVPILLDYLVNTFGPQSVPAGGQRDQAGQRGQAGQGAQAGQNTQSSDDAAKRILDNVCTACHGLNRVEDKNLDKDAWQGIVESMRAKGADLPDADIPALVDYLVKTRGPR